MSTQNSQLRTGQLESHASLPSLIKWLTHKFSYFRPATNVDFEREKERKKEKKHKNRREEKERLDGWIYVRMAQIEWWAKEERRNVRREMVSLSLPMSSFTSSSPLLLLCRFSSFPDSHSFLLHAFASLSPCVYRVTIIKWREKFLTQVTDWVTQSVIVTSRAEQSMQSCFSACLRVCELVKFCDLWLREAAQLLPKSASLSLSLSLSLSGSFCYLLSQLNSTGYWYLCLTLLLWRRVTAKSTVTATITAAATTTTTWAGNLCCCCCC